MAYILLALGALMSLVGLVAMVTGYPMIEIERGWAMLITGAVLLSGGLVVCALGLVVRNLIVLRGALSVVGTRPASGDEAAMRQAFDGAPLTPSLPAMPSASPSFEMPPPRLPAEAFDAIPGLGVAVPAAAAALAASATPGRDAPHSPEPRQVHEPLAETHDAEPIVSEAQVAESRAAHVEEAHAPEALVPEAYVPEVHPPEVSHEAAYHAPVEADAGPDHPKSHDDWLDQAFSAFDYEVANGHGRAADTSALPEPHSEPTPAFDLASIHEVPAHHDTEHAAEPDEASASERHASAHELEAQPVEHHETEPHVLPAEAPATAPVEPAATLAVIGRYDSEGTSYVMYSDGSIEAQSDAGVYRFNSMAELKAFIEN